MQFEIVAEASAGLLCRLIGLAAQHDLAAPDMRVRVVAGMMTVEIELEDVGDQLCVVLAEKMRRSIGVETVEVGRIIHDHRSAAAAS